MHNNRSEKKEMKAIVDSGAFPHMSLTTQVLQDVKQTSQGVATAEGGRMPVRHKGFLNVLKADGQKVKMGPALVPDGLTDNLLSVSAFVDVCPERKVVFGENYCVFIDEDGNEVIQGTREGGHFVVRLPTPGSGGVAVVAKGVTAPHPHTFVPSSRRRSKRAQRRYAMLGGMETRSQKRKQAAAARNSKFKEPEHKSQSLSPTSELELGQIPEEERCQQQQVVEPGAEEAMALHQKLHHLNLREVKWMVQNGKAPGEVSIECKNWFVGKTKFHCVECFYGKVSKKPLKQKNKKQKEAIREYMRQKGIDNLTRVKEVKMGMDLNGPNARGVGSHSGAMYALLLRKKKTKYSWLRFLKKKSDVFEELRVTLPLILTTLRKNRRLVILSDLGTEFCSEKVENLLSSLGIEHRYTSRNSSLKNGVVERHFRTLEQDVATTRKQAGLTKGFWPDLMQSAHQARLHMPSRSLKNHRSPFEEEFGKSSQEFRSRMQPVGCLAVGLRTVRTSMGDRGEQLVYLGEKEGGDGNRLLNLKTRKIVDDRSARFAPHVFPCRLSKIMRKEVYAENLEDVDALGLLEAKLEAEGTRDVLVVAGDVDDEEETPWTEEEEIQQEESPRRSTRARGKPDVYQPTKGVGLIEATRRALRNMGRGGVSTAFFAGAQRLVEENMTSSAFAALEEEKDPTVFREAMTKSYWQEAYNKEIQKLIDNKAFEWQIRPDGAKLLDNTVVFKTKRDENNVIVERKARGVVRGDRQAVGDGTFTETFAPTVRMDTVRMFFSLAVQKGWNIRQADVVSAFLLAMLDDQDVVYMRPFPGMMPPKGKEGCVLRLRKSLYGLKQAPQVWNKEMCQFLLSVGYKPSPDPCLFLRKREGKLVSSVLFHVDDILVAGEDTEVDQFMKAGLAAKFPIKDLGEPTLFLGMRVTKTANGYTWCQDAYVQRLLEKFKMVDARLKKTPISGRLYFEDGAQPADKKMYRQLVGALMYLMLCTRPDICFALNQLTRHFNEPQVHHWKAALRVLAYLKWNNTLGVAFAKKESGTLAAFTRGRRDMTAEDEALCAMRGWSDADWAGDEADRKSTSGYLVTLAGSIISFGCRKQHITATSSCTAELIALTLTTKEVLWQKQLYAALFEEDAGAVAIMEDNSGAKSLADSPKFSQKAKHLAVREFFCREKVASKEVRIETVKSANQLADMFTKPLGPQTFLPMRKKIGMVDCAERN
jgi:hypothetical protein